MIKPILLLLMLLGLNSSLLAKQTSLPLMPYPLSVVEKPGVYQLESGVMLTVNGMSQERENTVIRLLQHQLAQQNITLMQPSVVNKAKDISRIDIEVNRGKALAYRLPTLTDDESYLLRINAQGVQISASTDFGALRALATLRQLIATQVSSNTVTLPQLVINDMPRFPWRGLLIDSARHFLSIEAIKRQLDGMAAAKLNVFHWHLTDDQGWRFESTSYPKLHQLASNGQYYSQQQIRDVVAYANELGIRVIPEVELPGHVSAIAVAYPELMAVNKNYHMEPKWGVFEALLDPSNELTYQFIDSIIGELAALFPDQYIHIGGNQVNPIHWQQSEAIQHYMQQHQLADEHQLQAHFNQKVQQILIQHNKKMMGWDEIFHPDLPQDIMVQSSRGMGSLAQVAQAGYQGLLSAGFYIDQGQPTSFHYRHQALKSQPNVMVPSAQDQVQAWQFVMPRLKGSEIRGTLVLVRRNDYVIHAYVKLDQQSYQKVKIDRALATKQSQINFSLDTWMGPLRGEFDLRSNKPVSGRLLLGNNYYAVQGQQLAAFDFSEVKVATNLSSAQQANILGGEAILWTELVNENNIDLRIWPRLFAIAERFWSNKSLTDVDDMYRRLIALDKVAGQFGVLSAAQQSQGFQSLLEPEADLSPLLVLAEQIEPASYYTRHHIKYRKGLYHQNAPLNQLVDFLPVESLALIKLEQQLQAFKKGSRPDLQLIIDTMRRWHFNFAAVTELIKQYPKLSSLAPLVDDARVINTLGLTVAQNCFSGVKMKDAETRRIKSRLAKLHQQVREIALSSGLFVEHLLEACRQ